MIYFFNADGTLIKQTPQVVVQGSSESNKIYFVAPLLPTGAVRVGFSLPNGHMTAKYLLTNDGALSSGGQSITDENGNDFYVWKRTLPPKVTKQAGEVIGQFYYTNATGEVIASVPIGFHVETGVTTLTPPEDLPEDTDEYISQILSTIAETKRDRYTPDSDGIYAYTVSKSGSIVNDNGIKVTENATGVTIPLRTGTGQVKVAITPTDENDATSKSYVDEQVDQHLTIVVDAQLSTTSENPVENKVVTVAIVKKLDAVTDATEEEIARLYCVNKDGSQNMAIVNANGELRVDNI